MTASQQPTGHDKAAQAVAATIRNSLDLRGIELTWSDVRAAASAAVDVLRAHDRAALADGDPDVAEALGLRVERQWPQERRLFVEHEGHPYGLDRYWHSCPACNPIEGEFEWIDRRRFTTDWREA